MSEREQPGKSVFISYANSDRRRIKQIIVELRHRGIIAEDENSVDPTDIISPGDSVRDVLKQAIGAASKVVVLWSDAGAESQFVNYEAGMAKALGKPTVVVIPKGGAARLPLELADTQVVELLPKQA